MAGTNAVFANDTSITLDWADVTGANLYHLQVAVKHDFSGTLVEDDNTLATSTKAFTDDGADDLKRFWRWRYSTDAGTTWSVWSEVGSYWLNTGASGDVVLSAGKWALFDPDDVSDIYTLVTYPVYAILPQSIFRAKERNRQGTLMTEWLISKDMITLEFEEENYVAHEQARELKRFQTVIRTAFLATYKTNGVDDVQNIWKVVFVEDPEFRPLSPGREDLIVCIAKFEEV